MFSNIILFTTIAAVTHAALLVQDNHHAVSLQSVVRHDQPQNFNTHFSAPVLTHSGPILTQSGPVLSHPGSLFTHGHLVHSTPVVQATPVVQHVTPVVHAAPLVHARPLAVAHVEPEHQAPANYEYSYSVDDPHTGDHKSQRESSQGGVVKGEYTLLQPDGSIRKVEYTADEHSGFNAIVHNSAPSSHVPSVPVHAAQVAHVAPLAHSVPAIPVYTQHH